MKEYKPYCYLIGWSALDIWYYGCEFANSTRKIANPENLWNIYFTSSKEVKKYRETYGEPDIIQIRKVFSNELDCRNWENIVLKKLNVLKSNKWLNKSNNKAMIAGKNKIVSQKTRNKISKNHRSCVGINNPMWGKSHSEETKNKISLKNKNKISWNKGIHRTEKEKEKEKMRGKRPSISGKNHPKFDNTIYKFKNIITNEIFEGTKYDFKIKFNLLDYSRIANIIRNPRKSYKDWIFLLPSLSNP